MNIIPTLFANTHEEILEKYSHLKSHFPYFHIDIMQKEFVNKDFFDEEIFIQLQKDSKTCEVHLMVKDYMKYIQKLIRFSCIKTFIIHYESFENKDELIHFVQDFYSNHNHIQLSLALNYNTTVEEVFDILSYFSQIMVMGIQAGAQGQELIDNQLHIASILKKLGCRVSLDGGVNDKTISKIAQIPFDQINVGSYLNQTKDIDSHYNVLLQAIIPQEKMIIIADIGGTHTKIYRGYLKHFSTDTIEIVDTSQFKSIHEIMSYIISSYKISTIILGVAGQKIQDSITMTHQELLTFNSKELEQKYNCEILLFNDLELSGYGISQQLHFTNSTSSKLNHFLEILITIGTGLGICHISNNHIVYSSQGGHLYAKDIDSHFFHFLKKELHKDEITFDDIISSKGLELRYYFDTLTYLSSKEIINLAKKQDEKVEKTISFFLQELLYFLKDCILFDNVVSTLYLAGEFLKDIISLYDHYLQSEFKLEITNKVHLEMISTNYLPFLGALKILEEKKS